MHHLPMFAIQVYIPHTHLIHFSVHAISFLLHDCKTLVLIQKTSIIKLAKSTSMFPVHDGIQYRENSGLLYKYRQKES